MHRLKKFGGFLENGDFDIYDRILKFLVSICRKLPFFRWLNTEKYEHAEKNTYVRKQEGSLHSHC